MRQPRHYSGSRSRWFWNRVKRLKDDADHGAMYSLGCALQNLEQHVMGELERVEHADSEHIPRERPNHSGRQARKR
jgi:hypothetical protein